ncbi:hypothetical protein SLS62_000891 [Diatrype stigma]|uniref:Fungal-specific transcription factor domain-containing protein n=1 Tax=Diatrype stigma TaxID=117547 RepID=A0AAN9YWZ6_9PEZI
MARRSTALKTQNESAISGDRVPLPCVNCSRPKRSGQGFGLRLSWPRQSDARRAVVLKSPLSSSSAVGRYADAHFVHTSYFDVEAYRGLAGSGLPYTHSRLQEPPTWNPLNLEALDRDLLDYYLANVVIRLALAPDTASTPAVLRSILAFSSLHRYGLQSQAAELKIAALQALVETSAVSTLDATETIHHAVTGLLICSFEIQEASCTSGQWTGHIVRVNKIINASSRSALLQLDSEVAIILDWFSKPPLPGIALLDLLSKICDVIYSREIPPDSIEDVNDYKGFLKVLAWRIRSVSTLPDTADSKSVPDDATLVTQLYQHALLLYVGQTCQALLGQSFRLQDYIDRAFSIITRLSSCKQQFPVFIVGCEARTDTQRALILDLIAKTEKGVSSRSYSYVKLILQAIWAQDDLTDGEAIGYWDRLTSPISRCAILPSFV